MGIIIDLSGQFAKLLNDRVATNKADLERPLRLRLNHKEMKQYLDSKVTSQQR
ncbi:MAG: hypothetical protein GY847_19410 [Proteobacteria bacterium]|nr:hypothetical protein [Pseudomonadota bacterium]